MEGELVRAPMTDSNASQGDFTEAADHSTPIDFDDEYEMIDCVEKNKEDENNAPESITSQSNDDNATVVASEQCGELVECHGGDNGDTIEKEARIADCFICHDMEMVTAAEAKAKHHEEGQWYTNVIPDQVDYVDNNDNKENLLKSIATKSNDADTTATLMAKLDEANKRDEEHMARLAAAEAQAKKREEEHMATLAAAEVQAKKREEELMATLAAAEAQAKKREEELMARLAAPEAQANKSDEGERRICDAVKAQSTKIKHTSLLHVYQIPLVEEPINISGCRVFKFGNESFKANRTIMVMGGTGSGKSTLIDGFTNFILGIRWDDEYRFKVVQEVVNGTQADSQTSVVTVYKLNHHEGFQTDYSLTIIDTPGFGDTRGIDRDNEITEILRRLFNPPYARVLEIDLVCFVVQAPSARLTHSQKYVFDSVLSIFGNDIAENIRVLVTFADGERPPVLEAITASGVPCPIEDGVPLHYKFNNSALFTCNKSDKKVGMCFSEMFWNMGHASMKEFFVALNQSRTKSLLLTRNVLNERKQLENLVENLNRQVRVGLSTMEELRQVSVILQTHEAAITANANFEVETEVLEPTQIDISGKGIFITNCQQCFYTCHDKCDYANDADKHKCVAMGSDGYCKVCPNHCHWSVHFNQQYKWEYIRVTKKQTVRDLKEKYEIATGEKNAVNELIKKLEDEYDEVQNEVTVLISKTSASLNRLKKIALRPDPLSTLDYIDILIKGEMTEAKSGWKQRVDSLTTIREKADTIAKVYRGENFLEKNERKTKGKPSFLTKLKRSFKSAK